MSRDSLTSTIAGWSTGRIAQAASRRCCRERWIERSVSTVLGPPTSRIGALGMRSRSCSGAIRPRGHPDRAAGRRDAIELGLEPVRVLGERVERVRAVLVALDHAMRAVGARREHAQQHRAGERQPAPRKQQGHRQGAARRSQRSRSARSARAVARRKPGCARPRRRPRRDRRAGGRRPGSARARTTGFSPRRLSPRKSSTISSRTMSFSPYSSDTGRRRA